MCGIAGAIGAVDDQVALAVRAMQSEMLHRGPDAEGYWESVQADRAIGVALAHRRLAILDLSPEANQPMADEAAGCVIVFNGEVYNFGELRYELQAAGVTFSTHGDTEVLLKAYVHWGSSCVERLRGMFAFAIWDPREQILFVARDRVGIKPLYMTTLRRPQGNVLLFASELRALLDTGLVNRRIDPVGLSSYLWNGLVIGPTTIVSGVKLLPPGTTQEIALSGEMRSSRRYWRLPAPGGKRRDTDELAAELENAVRLRMISDVPIAVFLSGGIDSSAIAALACRSTGARVKTFNLAFEEAAYDESAYARRVAAAIGTEHRELLLSEQSFVEQLGDMLDSVDQPTLDGVNTYLVSRAVREAGITVALAGTGGDELFGGYRSFVDVPRSLAARRFAAGIPVTLRSRLAEAITRMKIGPYGEVPPQARWGKLSDFLSTRIGLLETYQVAYGLFTRSFLHDLCERALETGGYYGLPVTTAGDLRSLIDEHFPLQSISNLELTCYAGERLLRDTDVFSMAVGLEVRVPLLDHRVIEAAAQLEEHRRYERLGRKQILRDIALKHLDPQLFERPKSGFQLPLELWCRNQLKGTVEETFHDRTLCQQVGLSPEAVGRLWRAFLAHAPGVHWLRVWSLFVLLRWSRQNGVKLS
ncbi:MAG: asparagine synthase (glutamine-hydrolyzing) [Planctomycetales bacterium]|nr:asparagine synthase (glutamine-hydrolyzing) [Planctomycetales bacterium]